MKDFYQTITNEVEGEFKDRGSKFLAYITPLSTERDFDFFLEKIKKEHPKARHHCYAWRLGVDGNHWRANDDGEPSGTAGKPILGQIDSFGLSQVGAVVVRYFGGTLLGTSGLIQAYRESTAHALRQATIIEKLIEDFYNIQFTYEYMPDVMHVLKKMNIPILQQNFEEKGTLQVAFRQSETAEKLLTFKAQILKISLDYAEQFDLAEFTEGGILLEKAKSEP
jgi:uncharacterized YigZ family protein